MARKGKVSRKTKETSISVEVNIDGKGQYKIDTGIAIGEALKKLLKNLLASNVMLIELFQWTKL